MGADSKIEYWMELATYDFETAKAMLRTERYLYVGFMAHQVVEKSLKALYWKRTASEPPYTHDLWKLIRNMNLALEVSDGLSDLIDQLQPLNIEARYPQDRERLISYLSRERCVALIGQVERMMAWIQSKL
jgi:HEPN domain-containing protein